jgi:SAM-dependent methyltransferase
MSVDFVDVTEISGDQVSKEQVERLCHRYYWAGGYCADKSVLEVACGTGSGLGYLLSVAQSLTAGDYSQRIVEMAQSYYGDRIDIRNFDAQNMPFEDGSFDVVIIFEALYYIPDAARFVAECARVLRPSGKLLVANANKDLFDFNPSPHSFTYHGVVELQQLLSKAGFKCDFFGYMPVDELTWRQKLLRPIKKIAVNSGLMPKSMAGKKLLKRLVFGALVDMPYEIGAEMFPYAPPDPIPANSANTKHKVIYCAASLPE